VRGGKEEKETSWYSDFGKKKKGGTHFAQQSMDVQTGEIPQFLARRKNVEGEEERMAVALREREHSLTTTKERWSSVTDLKGGGTEEEIACLHS